MLPLIDKVNIKHLNYNQETGEQSYSDSATYPAFIDASSKVRYTKTGTPYSVEFLIVLPKTCPVKEGDLIKITKQFSCRDTFERTDKEYKVLTVKHCGFLGLETHIEVTV